MPHNSNLTPQEALDLLDQAISQLTVKRSIHIQLQQAIEVLKEFISNRDGKLNV